MDSGKGRKRRNEDTISCECGCGSAIFKYGTDGRVRRFVRGHQFKGNKFGEKAYCLEEILEAVEPHRPFCACGCKEQLEVPSFMQQKGHGVKGIISYWKRHPYRPKHGIWDKRTQNFIDGLQPISRSSLGLIYGTLLGDCAILFPNKHSRFPRLAWTHGEPQQYWMRYKANRLSELRPNLRLAPNAGYGDMSVSCSTACHPQLVEVYSVTNPNKTGKQVSLTWLEQVTTEGIAWWYMDDGSLQLTKKGSPCIQLHTEGFSLAENHLIVKWLSALGYTAKAKTYRRARTGKVYPYLYMGTNAARKFLSDIKPFAIPSMEYKFRGC